MAEHVGSPIREEVSVPASVCLCLRICHCASVCLYRETETEFVCLCQCQYIEERHLSLAIAQSACL